MTESIGSFDWPLCFEAERLLRGHVDAFVGANKEACRLAVAMRATTGTDFFEWVDHLVVNAEHVPALRAAGLIEEKAAGPAGGRVFWHPRAMLPRVVVPPAGQCSGGAVATPGEAAGVAPVPLALAIRLESLEDFLLAQGLEVAIEGGLGAGLRQARVSGGGAGPAEFFAVERLGYRGWVVTEPTAARVRGVERARKLWRTRARDFSTDEAGLAHAWGQLEAVFESVDRDVACDLFFAEERRFWESRNRAAQIQKRRQDRLGLGWGNHDHHTFRSSRALFPDLMAFLEKLGFVKRERFYAGAEAGWGAQILEQAEAGIVVFADVDLMPDETTIDFSAQRLAEAPRLGTVGLWCGLHGDSFLQAGMHHLEARFDFGALREQLSAEGVNTMRPFSDFDFLRQAFTEGERWAVEASRVARLCERALVTAEQANGFLRGGAIGSHLENLQRKGGFKGFNQKSVSAIIAATDPRMMQGAH